MWIFYWINVIGNLQEVITVLIVVSIIITIGSLVLFFIFTIEDCFTQTLLKNAKRTFIIGLFTSILSSILTTFIPSKDTMYLMLTTKGAEILAQTPEASKVREAMNLGLDRIITELKKDK